MPLRSATGPGDADDECCNTAEREVPRLPNDDEEEPAGEFNGELEGEADETVGIDNELMGNELDMGVVGNVSLTNPGVLLLSPGVVPLGLARNTKSRSISAPSVLERANREYVPSLTRCLLAYLLRIPSSTMAQRAQTGLGPSICSTTIFLGCLQSLQ